MGPMMSGLLMGNVYCILIYLAESEHDTSLPIMDSYDKSLFRALFITIYHGLQWSIM